MTPTLKAVTTVVVLGVSLAADAVAERTMDAKQLIGMWTGVSATIDGRPLAPETVKALRLTLTADRYRSERAGQILFDSTYKVDATKDPPHIDMVGTEGELAGKAAPGIYQLDGDMLTLCYVMPGGERPTKFASEPQSGDFLVVYRRTSAP